MCKALMRLLALPRVSPKAKVIVTWFLWHGGFRLFELRVILLIILHDCYQLTCSISDLYPKKCSDSDLWFGYSLPLTRIYAGGLGYSSVVVEVFCWERYTVLLVNGPLMSACCPAVFPVLFDNLNYTCITGQASELNRVHRGWKWYCFPASLVLFIYIIITCQARALPQYARPKTCVRVNCQALPWLAEEAWLAM
jgi:hypothetical protein